MVWKKIVKKLRKEEKEYPNRFLKFYHLNKKKLNKTRKGKYHDRKKAGQCIRCYRKAVEGIVFCGYHQMKQKEYNRRARSKE